MLICSFIHSHIYSGTDDCQAVSSVVFGITHNVFLLFLPLKNTLVLKIVLEASLILILTVQDLKSKEFVSFWKF